VLDEDGNPTLLIGADLPFNGFCPCTEVVGGFEPSAFGRAPATIGTLTFLLRYADGISVVVNVNSNEADPAEIRGVTTAVHDLAAAAG
jgi:hypothetical protein